jgi:hypothetical protein
MKLNLRTGRMEEDMNMSPGAERALIEMALVAPKLTSTLEEFTKELKRYNNKVDERQQRLAARKVRVLDSLAREEVEEVPEGDDIGHVAAWLGEQKDA